MISFAQVFLLFLAVSGMILVILRYRQRRIGSVASLFWLLLWIGTATVILYPNSTVVIARLLGIGRGTDLVLYISIIVIMYLLFKVYVRLEQVDREMTQIVRAIAMREAGLGHSESERDVKSTQRKKNESKKASGQN